MCPLVVSSESKRPETLPHVRQEQINRVRYENVVRPSKDGVLLRLRVSPGSKRNFVNGLYGEAAVRLSVAAPPVGGRANAEVEKFLSRLFGVPRGDVSVVGGASGRDKTVLVRGARPEHVRARLGALL